MSITLLKGFNMEHDDIHLVFKLESGAKLIEPTLAASYRGDFYGLLRYLKIDEALIPYIFKLNGIRSSTEFKGKIKEVRLVSPTILDK